MTEPEDPIEELPKQLAVSLGALVVVALMVAGVLGVVALAAANYLVGDDTSTATSEPTMYFPTPAPDSSAEAREGDADDPGNGRPGEDRAAEERRSRQDKAGKKRQRAGDIVLHARPLRAAPFERVRLFGRYPGGNGATLQVQRKQGRWVFFPTSATVNGGRFETWVQSGRRGVNEFRVVDRSSGARSRPVEVRIAPNR